MVGLDVTECKGGFSCLGLIAVQVPRIGLVADVWISRKLLAVTAVDDNGLGRLNRTIWVSRRCNRI